jgi:protein-L-isoaspartate(D-aspartate) O-methyltransferase
MLREAMISRLRRQNVIRSSRVATAFAAVPRHIFAPGEPLEQAYGDEPVVTKRDADGTAVSSVSAPGIQAMMLEQAGLSPGMRVLEIGSGGYNAALLAELAGPAGEVTTADIDPEVARRASAYLTEAGYGRVNVLVGDAENGVDDHAPYDRIIVTAGAWDIPPAWFAQLAPGGRLVVPLRMRGLTRSVAFEQVDGHLASLNHQMCGFVPMQGAGAQHEHLVHLYDEEVALRLDDDRPLDEAGLRQALLTPRVEAWSGVRFGGMESFDGLFLWLAACLPGFALLSRRRTDAARKLADPSTPVGAPVLVAGRSFAYHTFRQVDADADLYEFGAYAHGPDAARLAEQLSGQINVWDRDHRGAVAQIAAFPAGTADAQLPAGYVIDKRHCRITISWP